MRKIDNDREPKIKKQKYLVPFRTEWILKFGWLIAENSVQGKNA